MSAIADARGFNSTLVLTKNATSGRIKQELQRAAGILRAGDLLLLTYSGHGSQVPDLNSDEGDRKDETWVLYDRQFIDDELYAAFGQLDAGVRTFVLSDSCHSGTVTREAAIGELLNRGAAINEIADTTTLREFVDTESFRFRLMPSNKQDEVFSAHADLYDKIQAGVKSRDRAAIGATVILISGCQDNQLSSDGDHNGLFTGTLLKTWDSGRFSRGHRTFCRRIRDQMPPWQSPNYSVVGNPNPEFEQSTPFTI